MAKQLKIGDVVKIKKASEYHNSGTSHNPACNGVISELYPEHSERRHSIRVKWENGTTNVYRPTDLKLAKEKVKEDLLAEIIYKDSCGDFVEVDTEMSGDVYFRTGKMDGDDPEFDRTIVLSKKQVKKIRKQLKAWLDKQVSAA